MGEAERLLFAYVQMRGQTTVRSGELLRPLQLTPAGERNLLSRLSKAGWIARVRRGLYLIPPKLPLGGKWSPDEILALNTAIADAGGRYQICGPNAFNRYGFDEQIPTRIYAYNNKLSRSLTIGAVALSLIKVASSRLGDIEEDKDESGLDRCVLIPCTNAGRCGLRLVAVQQSPARIQLDTQRPCEETGRCCATHRNYTQVRRQGHDPSNRRFAGA